MRIILGDGSIVYTRFLKYDAFSQLFDSETGVIIDIANIESIDDKEEPA